MTDDGASALRQGDLSPFAEVMWRARLAAHAPGEFVGQESFMTAREIVALATAAGVGAQATVLDVCCGPGGPGRLVTRELGCRYLGVDASAGAVAIARRRARAERLDCRYEVARVPPLPAGTFDVVLLLETLLAFPDKAPLLRAVAGALRPGGRFALTVEAGAPLSAAERAAMSLSATVHLDPLADVLARLAQAGLAVVWQEDHSELHRRVAAALATAYAADADAIVACQGRAALEHLLASHRLWVEWLGSRRVAKVALVAERVRVA